MSIDAIIERIGGSKRTIYNEFGSKAASGSSARVLFVESYFSLPSIQVCSAATLPWRRGRPYSIDRADEKRLPCMDGPQRGGVDRTSIAAKMSRARRSDAPTQSCGLHRGIP
ncbi:hypothetical protein [Bradyrhizobium japonicum]|uniref:hypothetical protein n=1 Tax=Bradyrhizobium japonicum TaxID=375 RepID=UPI0028160D65|nr:hypothetical protein [Bradyrhizobium japonicum]